MLCGSQPHLKHSTFFVGTEQGCVLLSTGILSVYSSACLPCRWNTPLDEEDVAPEEHRATWGQGEAPPLPPPAASRKRPLEDDDEIDEDVKRRLAALQGGGVD